MSCRASSRSPATASSSTAARRASSRAAIHGCCATRTTIRASTRSSTAHRERRDVATTATNHWKLGLFVVAGILAAAGTVFWLAAHRFQRDALQAVSYFDESVQGLDVGSP